MRYLLAALAALLLLPIAATAQSSPNHSLTARRIEGRWRVAAGSHRFEGTAGWRLTGGDYLTLLALDGAGVPATLRHYTADGRETHHAAFAQVINLALDPAGRTAVFHDGRVLRALDLATFQERQFAGAGLAFAVGPADAAGRTIVAYYEPDRGAVKVGDARIALPEAPHQLMYVGDRLLVLSRHALHEVTDGRAVVRRQCPTGTTALWLRPSGNAWTLREKERTPARTRLHTWRTTDLLRFELTNTRELTGAWVAAPALRYRTSHYAGHPTPTREPIRGPLHYADTAVFGPVGNSYNEVQDYNGIRYLHPGVDLLGTVGDEVRAVRSGVVRAVLTTGGAEYWRVAVSYGAAPADSVGYLYAHLDQSSIAFVPGDSVRAGERIANLVDFFSFNFDHCHFARIADGTRQWNGAWWTLDDPLADMVNHRDPESPRLLPAAPTGELLAFRRGADDYLDPNNLTGAVEVISRPADHVNSALWNVDVYDERYALRPVRPAGQPSPALFDTLAYRFDFRNDNYRPGPFYVGRALNTLYSHDQTCFATGNYQERAFFHLLTAGDGDGQFLPTDSLRRLNTAAYPDGAYWLSVTVHDAVGNVARDSMQVQFRNGITGRAAEHDAATLRLWPNPATDVVRISGLGSAAAHTHTLTLVDVLGRRWPVVATPDGPDQHRVNLGALPAGAYLLELSAESGKGRRRLLRL